MENNIVMTTYFPEISDPKRGKVRDIYDLDDILLIIATDRISAFDVVLPGGIPGKGKVLNLISNYWFEKTTDIIPNHLITLNTDDYPEVLRKHRKVLEKRSMLVKKAKPLSVECIVRGYISGSGWKEYQESSSVCGIPLPSGLLESSKLENPIFTPSTKAQQGEHDENITFGKTVEILGKELAEKVKEVSLELYYRGRDIAVEKGIIIADTKFEFGIDEETGNIILIDEVLTPDSSRFWPLEEYKPGGPQMSFDKQFVRDYLSSIGWDKNPPAPELPKDIIEKTSQKYTEVLAQLTGIEI